MKFMRGFHLWGEDGGDVHPHHSCPHASGPQPFEPHASAQGCGIAHAAFHEAPHHHPHRAAGHGVPTRETLCSLADLPDGRKARVVDYDGESCERGHLYAMGITPGAEVECGGAGFSQRTVRVRNCSYSLNHDVARRITCSLTDCWPEGMEDGDTAVTQETQGSGGVPR